MTSKLTATTPLHHNQSSNAPLIMICIYMFLVIERPWESIRYLHDIPVERPFAILMILVAISANKFKIVESPINKWVYGLLAIHFLLAPFAYSTGYALEQGIEFLKIAILFLLMLAVVDNIESLKTLITVFIYSNFFYMLHSLWEYHNGRMFYRMGITRMIGVDSTFNDPNTFSASLVLTLPFLYMFSKNNQNKKIKIFSWVYYSLVVLCLVLTGSRSATIVFLCLIFLWVTKQKGSKKISILMLSGILLATTWHFMPAEKQVRIRTLWDENAGPANAHESAEGREFGFIAGWNMFKYHPLTGVGAGGKNFIGYRVDNLDGVPSQAHNLYGEVLGEFGFIGSFLFVGLVVSIYKSCTNVERLILVDEGYDDFINATAAIKTTVVLLLIFGLAGHNFYRPLWLWLAAWSGSLQIIMADKYVNQ